MTEYKIGGVYDVNHSRKGKFTIRVMWEDEEWVAGSIVRGTAQALCNYNVKETGEEITLRKSFITESKFLMGAA